MTDRGSKAAFRIRRVFPKKSLMKRILRLPDEKLKTITEEVREGLIREDLTQVKIDYKETNLHMRRKNISIPKISLISDEDHLVQKSSSHGKSSSIASVGCPSTDAKRKGFLHPEANSRRRTIILVEEVDSTVKHSSR